MASTKRHNSIKNLMEVLPRGEPVETATLVKHGVSPFLASYLSRNGWLQHLSRGVYLLRGDKLTRDGSLRYLARHIPGFHVGGKTALAWRGVQHNLSVRENLELWGDKPFRLPTWLTTQFDCHYQTTQLFAAELPVGHGLQPLPALSDGILVSTPERALLEMLSNVGKRQSVEEARNLVEGLRNPRPQVLSTLLSHCVRIKVVRLAKFLADEAELDWADIVRSHSDQIGSDSRWTVRTKSGELLSLKK